MKTSELKKKVWFMPEVCTLNIKKDTFSGSTLKTEAQNGSAQVPKDPTPR
jgi:hypothetical protein